MVLKGERLSYRTLDVEQIGSVYEAIMGFRVELSAGRSIAVRSQTKTGASVIVDLERLLCIEGSKRRNELKSLTGRELTRKVSAKFREASTVEDLTAVIDGVIDRDATPSVIGSETPILQPTDERRKSGSHYTPRSLTQPIVEEALRPILERFGDCPLPEDILSIKVLDPASGSGAFLVEVCRYLAEQLVKAWSIHGGSPENLVDDDELLHARRMVAQRCLYGVDKNPMAVDLAKLSIWLVTLAQNHEFTFIDHALRHGDSLVGLTRKQIELFHWKENPKGPQASLHSQEIDKACRRVSELRQLIQQLGGEIPEEELQDLMDEMNHELSKVRQIADLVILAFFNGKKVADRKEFLSEYATLIQAGDKESNRKIGELTRELPFSSFHWELEFPEVFERENGGFDAVVGNPPYAGKNTVAAAHPFAYPEWLKSIHSDSHGNSDYSAHFFRRSFNLLRGGGTLGLIATNTISQGDTRSTGLRWICEHGGDIYQVQRRYKWPGEAAVIVSVIHVFNGDYVGTKILDRKRVGMISAFLFNAEVHSDPKVLKQNLGKSFQGSVILGMGFTFDDSTRNQGVATPISEMERLIFEKPNNQEVIFPFIGGDEFNKSPTHSHYRYCINFHDWPLRRNKLGVNWGDVNQDMKKEWLREGIVPLDYPFPTASDWPELLMIVEEKVKPTRAHLTKNAIGLKRKKFWWQYGSLAKKLYDATSDLNRVLAISQATPYIQFAFIDSNQVFQDSLIILALPTFASYCTLQSRIHEAWSLFFGSSLGTTPYYIPSDCFQTYPFPLDWETHPSLEAAGEEYYNFRADLMVQNNEGMTKTYNRFHHPEERSPDIIQLRKLHADMDRAVLDAYGWTDIPTDCEFLLDYEIDHETWGKKRKPYRYRWPDEVHDEVLSRLLDLNAKYAEQEKIEGRNKRK
ncbi:MAG: N-6 DNA methylase [Bacteroidetes bacterium]|nr:N-6 DNA methylase [Bacteroidota bacterium]